MNTAKRVPGKIRAVRQILPHVLSWGLAVGVVAAGFYYGAELFAVIRRVDGRWLAAGLGFYAVNYVFRAARLRLLSGQQIRIWPEGLHATCLHGFATYMLPLRSGELMLPLTLQTTSGLTIGEGGHVLVRARMFDLLALGLLTVTAALLADIALDEVIRWIWLIAGVSLAVIPVLASRLGHSASKSRMGWLRRLSAFADCKPFSIPEIGLSLSIWMAVAGCFYGAARAIGLELAPMQIWFLITLQLPLQLIPVQGFANAGNHEGGWVAGLVLMGVPAAEALEVALASHAILLSYAICLGPTAMVLGRFMASDPK